MKETGSNGRQFCEQRAAAPEFRGLFGAEALSACVSQSKTQLCHRRVSLRETFTQPICPLIM
jgi:hypothetical protein